MTPVSDGRGCIPPFLERMTFRRDLGSSPSLRFAPFLSLFLNTEYREKVPDNQDASGALNLSPNVHIMYGISVFRIIPDHQQGMRCKVPRSDDGVL